MKAIYYLVIKEGCLLTGLDKGLDMYLMNK